MRHLAEPKWEYIRFSGRKEKYNMQALTPLSVQKRCNKPGLLSHKGLRSIATATLACGLLMLAGCTQSVSVDSGVSQQQGAYVNVHYQVVWDPPGSYLASLDTTQALLNLSLSNATVSSTSGTFTLTVKDLNANQNVGQQSFGYVINGASVYAQDPTGVYNWLQQFTGYANIDVIVDVEPTLQATTATNSSATGSAVYQGQTYGSATVGWDATTGGGSGCTTRICPNQ
jgi:hypothetical protein